MLRGGDLIVLVGPLGAGKAPLDPGIGAGLGVGAGDSPTFVIARVHRDGRVPLVHVDAYRLDSVAEVDDLDLDAWRPESVIVIDWGRDSSSSSPTSTWRCGWTGVTTTSAPSSSCRTARAG